MRHTIYFLVLVLCVVGSSLGCKSSRTPADTVKEFLKYEETGNADEAAKLLSKSGMSKAGGMEKFREYISTHSRLIQKDGGIEWIMVKEEKITGDVAEITVEVKIRNGKTGKGGVETIPYHLNKEDGEWKINEQM